MGQIIDKYCIRCGGITQQQRNMEPESNWGDFDFEYVCLRCEGVDMSIIKKLDPKQQTL